MEITAEELSRQLERYTGSTQFYEYGMFDYKFHLTEGVKHLADSAGAYFLIEVIYSWQYKHEIAKERFQVWKLERVSDNSFVINCTDGNDRKLCKQNIPFSDFPLDNITLWLVNRDTLMLPNEY